MTPKRYSDLSTGAKLYVAAITCTGIAIVAHSAFRLYVDNTPWKWLILAALTLVSGSATVKLPSLPATISVSETFVFTSVLLFGAPAGTLTVALDALVISCVSHRKTDPLYKPIFNIFALPITIWIAAQVYFSLPNWQPYLSHVEPLFGSSRQIPTIHLLGPLLVLASVYFALNSWLIAFAIALERRRSAWTIWRTNFALLSLNYFGGASVAALLVTYTRQIEWAYLALILPLLLALYFTFRNSMGRVADANEHLEQLNSLYMSTIETLAMAIDAKDQITHGHIRRVQTYAVGLAKKIGVTDTKLIRAIEAAALLHDMGKLAVPEYILNKPGPLTPAEFEKMKLHASVGADILSSIDFPYPVVPIVRHHHENWDGTGYPDGLVGSDIPIGARILSVVDCFDALTSDRPYRPRLPDEEAIRILISRKATMYDPLVVDTFLEVHQEIAPEAAEHIGSYPLKAITHASSVASSALTQRQEPLDEIAASTEEMLTLFHLAGGLSQNMGLADIGDLVAKHLRRLVPCSLCVFFVYRVDSDTLVAAHAVGEGAPLVSGLSIDVGERLSGWVAANRRTIRNSDPVLDLGELARHVSPRPRSCLSTPMLSGGQLVGVLALYSPQRDSFTEEHQRLLEVVARQVSSLLKQAYDFENLRRATMRDSVTGLPNVDQLRQIASGDLNKGLSEPASVLLVQIPSAAKGEDSTSNALASSVTKAIRRNLRAADLLFRHWDGSFVVLLLHTSHEITLLIAERVRDAVEQELTRSGGAVSSARIAISSGPQEGSTIEKLLDRAMSKLASASSGIGWGEGSVH